MLVFIVLGLKCFFFLGGGAEVRQTAAGGTPFASLRCGRKPAGLKNISDDPKHKLVAWFRFKQSLLGRISYVCTGQGRLYVVPNLQITTMCTSQNCCSNHG